MRLGTATALAVTLLMAAIVVVMDREPPGRPGQAETATGAIAAELTAPLHVSTMGLGDKPWTLPPLPPPIPLPRVLITPTGVPVIVEGLASSGYLVRSPCDNIVEVSDGEPVWSARVVIDPGHGGRHNTGAWGYNGLVEGDLNLALGFAIQSELEARGVSTVLTRTGDYGTSFAMRADLADILGAEVMLSLHHNAPLYYSRRSPGTEVYVQSDSPSSTRLGGLLYEEVSHALDSAFDISWSGTRFTGVSRVLHPSGYDLYRILRLPDTTTVLVEYGYLANPAEARLFATEEYLNVAAFATADAVVAFLETDRPGTGFHSEPRVFDARRATVLCHETPLE